MRWLFLVPLTTGLMSGYLSYRLRDEIAYLTGALTIICLLLCLFIAPWQMQLFILILVGIAARLLWLKIQQQALSLEENLQDIQPHRTYRGIAYETEDKGEVPILEQKKEGTYRGKHWESSNTILETGKNSKFIRKYRGIPLNQGKVGQEEG